jgi:hypothetical protein
MDVRTARVISGPLYPVDMGKATARGKDGKASIALGPLSQAARHPGEGREVDPAFFPRTRRQKLDPGLRHTPFTLPGLDPGIFGAPKGVETPPLVRLLFSLVIAVPSPRVKIIAQERFDGPRHC